MRRLKTIDEIYAEVRDYGLVITNDAALCTALNNRIDTARIGVLAMTPRGIARLLGGKILGRALMSDLELIAAVSEETGLGIRQVFSEIENFREIRRYTRDVGAYISTRNARRIYESYRAMPTLERALGEMDPDDERIRGFFQPTGGVAVIGEELFDDLDKHCNSTDFDPIDIHTEGSFEIDTIHEIGNDRQLAENAASLIDPANATDYAIVLSAGSSIADAMRTSLYRRGIPFMNRMVVRDMAPIRDYLSFLALSLEYRTIRVRAVKELYANYNGFFKNGREEYLLHRQRPDDMRDHAWELKETMRAIVEDGMTFAQVRDAICDRVARGHVTTILRELEMEDRIVTPDSVSDLRFAVDNVELHHNEEDLENERHGVVIVDCKNSIFVDRPVVIYLGMEQEWNIPVIGKRYLDAENETELNAIRLEALVQQGQRRVYLVNTSKNGKPVRPCLTFDLIYGRPCDGFGSMCSEVITGRWSVPLEEEVRSKGEDDIDRTYDQEIFSKSTFNDYVSCPRRYMFGRLLPTPDEESTEFGNLVHEFAELYACYPRIVEERGVDSFVDMISDRYSGLSSPLMEELDRERIRLAMNNVRRFIDTLKVDLRLDTRNERRSHPNRFMEELDLEYTSDSCESDRSSQIHAIHGKFDLFWRENVFDYKTGRPKDIKDIVKAMDLDAISRFPEFQPMIYLALAQERTNCAAEFNLFYALDGGADSVPQEYNVWRNVRHLSVCEGSIQDHIKSSPTFREEFRAMLSKVVQPHSDSVIDALDDSNSKDPRDWDKDETYINRICDLAGNGSSGFRKGLPPAIRKLAGLVDGGLILDAGTVYIPQENLDRFLERLDIIHEEAMGYMLTQFPASPRGQVNCPECPYFQACTGCRTEKDQEVMYDE